MTEELKQKAKDFIDRINKESGGNWFDKYYLTDLLVMFATEATKELQEKLEIEQNARGDWFGKAVTKDRQLTEAKELLGTLVSICKSCVPLETLKLNEQFILKAEAFLKE